MFFCLLVHKVRGSFFMQPFPGKTLSIKRNFTADKQRISSQHLHEMPEQWGFMVHLSSFLGQNYKRRRMRGRGKEEGILGRRSSGMDKVLLPIWLDFLWYLLLQWKRAIFPWVGDSRNWTSLDSSFYLLRLLLLPASLLSYYGSWRTLALIDRRTTKVPYTSVGPLLPCLLRL